MASARSASGRARGRVAEVPQHRGEVAQADGDVGVVGAVGGFGDGQRPLGQWPGARPGRRAPAARAARLPSRMATVGWSGP